MSVKINKNVPPSTTPDPYLSVGGYTYIVPTTTNTTTTVPTTLTWNSGYSGTTYTSPGVGYNLSSVSVSTSSIGTYSNDINADALDVQGTAVVHGTLTVEEDIKIGEISLKERLEKIEERLAIINRKPELEDRWSKLRELGNEYRALEKDLIEKEYIWEVLKD